MALRVVSMAEMRLEVLLEAERSGESIASVCRRHGISRETYYQYRRRYLAEGMAGLADRSRAPASQPARMDPEVERAICELRRRHPRWGARRIRTELARTGVEAPAVSSVHQALRRNHLVADQPPRRRAAHKRFVREVSNDLWQIDATCVRVSTGAKAWVIDAIDDHSRLLLAAVAWDGPTADAAWDCFETAASRYGLPRQVLSDNGLCFSGKLHGVEVAFERELRALGVEPITAGPYHPQTLGKLERFHRTLKAWLAEEGPADDLVHLQELLDAFRHHYNTERPHQGIADLTPAERYDGGELPHRTQPPTPERMAEPRYPAHSDLRRVTATGNVGYRGHLIQVGRRWSGASLQIVEVGALVHLYHGETLVRVLAFDPDSYYQGLGTGRRRPVTAPVR